jgi:subtilisin family serine protease
MEATTVPVPSYPHKDAPYDDLEHGTHVTGTMTGSEPDGSNQIGVAPVFFLKRRMIPLNSRINGGDNRAGSVVS